MSLTNEERKAIVALRKQKAWKTLKEAEGIASLGYWDAVANRLYYACFYMTSALLLHHGYEANTHRGVIHLLGLHFIKAGRISVEMGKLYIKLYELRQSSDYDELIYLEEKDVRPLLVQGREYLEEIEKLIRESD
ncbi:MAG: HEPN domain-containing protein [Gammaproteobacteria bacterium]|nr:MAG: HEPN domain-containing protein [Gammaproteobacteria bacterium]